jgi:hypothetical protein
MTFSLTGAGAVALAPPSGLPVACYEFLSERGAA